MISVVEENEKMIEVVMKVDDEFWDNITQLTVFKEQKEIIHCKDCKYWRKNGDCYGGFDFEMDANDFCSRGEKK